MKSSRLLAGLFYAIGLGSLLIGWEEIGLAQTCTEVMYNPATCTPANAQPPIQNGSGEYCEYVLFVCQAAEITSCVDRWGIVYSGKCNHQPLGTTETFTCYEDSFLTLVSLPFYSADCKADASGCNCVWEETSTTNSVQTCDCYDE